MIVWLLFLVPVVWFVVWRYRRRNMYRLAAKIPAPKEELPIIGAAHTLSGDNEDILTALKTFSIEGRDHNGIVKVWLGHILYFVLINPTDLEVILKRCLEKDDLHRFLMQVTGNGAIFAPVSIWRRRRKVMVPAFSPKIIENFVNVFSEQSEKLVNRLTSPANKENFTIWPFLSAYTLDAVCETVMGIQINAQGNPNCSFLNSINNILDILTKRIFHLWLHPDRLFKISTLYKKFDRSVKELFGFVDNVITNKREEIKTELKKSNAVGEFNLESYKTKSFLDLLISLSGGEEGYTNVELREELVTLTVAGTDTSAVAIGYTLKLLGKYPEIQDKVYQELLDVFGDSKRLVEKEDLTKLKYLERVVKESLRLFPPVPFIIRKITEDIALPSGRVLPAGSGVVCSIWGVHRDPRYWGADAEKFDPDRFLPERFTQANTCSYMPFSSGPRNCVGYQYAFMSIKTALANILRRFKVVGQPENGPTPHIRVKLDVMMKPIDGYELALEKRTPATQCAQ